MGEITNKRAVAPHPGGKIRLHDNFPPQTQLQKKVNSYILQKNLTPQDDCLNRFKSLNSSTLTSTFISPRIPAIGDEEKYQNGTNGNNSRGTCKSMASFSLPWMVS